MTEVCHAAHAIHCLATKVVQDVVIAHTTPHVHADALPQFASSVLITPEAAILIVHVHNTRNHAVFNTPVEVMVNDEYCISRTSVTVVDIVTGPSAQSQRNNGITHTFTFLFEKLASLSDNIIISVPTAVFFSVSQFTSTEGVTAIG